jgi:hypothetical protein
MAETPIVSEQPRSADLAAVVLVGGVVILTLATAYIHSTLGGLLFTLNALGYATLAVAILLPIRLFDQFRWLIRLALLGFTLMTIGGWILFGARYDVAYLTKAIEAAMVVFLIASIYRFDGGPRGDLAHLRALPGELLGLVRGTR